MACETPKSPPGDYNHEHVATVLPPLIYTCETPKSPPGDYNLKFRLFAGSVIYECETPKSPPGDYNGIELVPSVGDEDVCV